jgi:thioredoxin 1
VKPIEITTNNFEAEVIKSELPVLIDFWAAWCGPCQVISPIMDELANEVSYAKICKVNVDEEPELAAAFGAMSIPFLAVVKDGEVVNRAMGAMPKASVLNLIKEYA